MPQKDLTMRYAFFGFSIAVVLAACTSSSSPKTDASSADGSSGGTDDTGSAGNGDGTAVNGSACKTDSDCASAYCIAQTGATVGVCTESCAKDGDCRQGGICFPAGNPKALCMTKCSESSACAKGLVCARYTEGNVCDSDAVLSKGAEEGGACARDRTCPASSLKCADDSHCRISCETSSDCPFGDPNRTYRCCSYGVSVGGSFGACYPASEVPTGYSCEDV